ncbi:MAG: T9SS type A sorting domain-containing protein [Bacteroidales bacterium]|nr:T9SS type A sorting domain-containing protein [Bacteroidales bacterium]
MKKISKLSSVRSVGVSILILSIFSMISGNTLEAQNYVTTYAGTGSPGFVNGDTSVASFNRPFGICIDPEGNIYLADAYNHVIRKIGVDGIVSTFAGSGTAGYLDGPAADAKFNQPINICLDGEGNMYVSDFINQRIRKISSDMMVTTVAGTGIAGLQDGPVDQAQFNYPRGICLDDTGNIYIGDSWNHRIRRISADSMVTTWAGGGTSIGVQSVGAFLDGSDTSARFYTPCELSVDQDNHIFVADAYNHRIRKIDPSRMVTTVAGSGDSGPTAGGFQNGPAPDAMFKVPTACHVTTSGVIFVGDGENQRVRKIGTDGMVTTFAGSGYVGFENGPDTLAIFNFPRGCVMDYVLNRLYVVDYYNHAVRIIHISPATGMGESPSTPEKLDIFPNPARNHIAISWEKVNQGTNLKILTSAGKTILQRSDLNLSCIQIDVSGWEPGIYVVEILHKEGLTENKKLIVL